MMKIIKKILFCLVAENAEVEIYNESNLLIDKVLFNTVLNLGYINPIELV